MYKHEQVEHWIDTLIGPVSKREISEGVGVSLSTVSRAIDKHFTGRLMYAWRPKGQGFYRLYFPLFWGEAECEQWLMLLNKSNQTKAKIRRVGYE